MNTAFSEGRRVRVQDDPEWANATMAAAAERITAAIRRQERMMALIGGDGLNTVIILDNIEEELDPAAFRVLRVRNPSPAPFSLNELISQLNGGVRVQPVADGLSSAVKQMAERLDREEQIVLIVEQADALDRRALLFLQSLSDAQVGGAPILQVLLVGTFHIWTLLEHNDFRNLRGRLAASVVFLGCPVQIVGDDVDLPSEPSMRAASLTSPPYPINSPLDRSWVIGLCIVLVAFCIVGIVVYLPPRGEPSSADPRPIAQPSPTSLASGGATEDVPDALTDHAKTATMGGTTPTVSAAQSAGEPPAELSLSSPAPALTRIPDASQPSVSSDRGSSPSEPPSPQNIPVDDLNRQFSRFLDQSGFAQITASQREVLFQQYLEKRLNRPGSP